MVNICPAADIALPGARERTTVLVTLPVHNEEGILRSSVERVTATLTAAGIDFTLAIAEDGSTDGTRGVIRDLSEHNPRLIVQTHPEKRGRGWALRTMWAKFDSDFYAFSDADFAAEPNYLVEAIRAAQRGSPVVTGSRYVPGARVIRPPLREIVSRAYNQLVRSLFHDGIRDHQCGLKVFSRDAVRTLLPMASEESWFWDTEILVLAKASGFTVAEIPVNWIERKVPRTQLRRLASDVVLHGAGLVRLKGARRLAPEPHALAGSPVRQYWAK
jgi:glycosyltransferase involved in cell wall biosynthesis